MNKAVWKKAVWNKALLPLLAALCLLPVSAGAQQAAFRLADFAAGSRVPNGSPSTPVLYWSASANNGLGGWTIVGAFSIFGTQTANTVMAGPTTGAAAPTFRALVGADLAGTGINSNNTQIGIGTTATTTDRVSVNPSGTAENGVTVTMPSGATGRPLQIKGSTGTLLADIDAQGDADFGYTALNGGTTSQKGISLLPGSEIIRGGLAGTQANITLDPTGYVGGAAFNTLVTGTTTLGGSTYEFISGGGVNRFQPRYSGVPGLEVRANGTGDLLQLNNPTGTATFGRFSDGGGLTNYGYHTINALSTPTAPTFTTATTGGSLAASTTYYYRITAVSGTGETLASTEASQATGAGTATNTITLTWTAVTGAESYNIYGRTTGAEQKIANVTALTYTDTGSVTPSGTLPTANSTGPLLFNSTIGLGTNGVGGRLYVTTGSGVPTNTYFDTAGSIAAGGNLTAAGNTQLQGNLTLIRASTYTVAHTMGSEYCAFGNASSGAFTITLPTTVGAIGRIYVIKKTDSSANAVTIATTSSQTIDGATTYSLPAQYNSVTVISDGANWNIIAKV